MNRTYLAKARKDQALQTQDKLAEATWGLLATLPDPRDLSVDAVAAAAGVSRATVFNAHGNKAGLLMAAFAHFARSQAMDDMSDVVHHNNLNAATQRFCAAFVRLYAAHGAQLARLRAYAALDPAIGAVVQARDLRRRQGLTVLLQRHAAQATCHLSACAEQRTVSVLAAVLGFDAVMSLIAQHGERIASRLIQQTIQAIIDAALLRESAHH
jgi:AcrR family transcriptional regulator